MAIRELEIQSHSIAPLQKVVLYQKYDVNRDLLRPALIALTTRDEPIEVNEGREEARKPTPPGHPRRSRVGYPYQRRIQHDDVHGILHRAANFDRTKYIRRQHTDQHTIGVA